MVASRVTRKTGSQPSKQPLVPLQNQHRQPVVHRAAENNGFPADPRPMPGPNRNSGGAHAVPPDLCPGPASRVAPAGRAGQPG